MQLNNRFTRFVFFGNYFYGICAIALSVEAVLQQKVPLNSWIYYAVIFSLTVVYYSIAYITDKNPENSANKRALWYAKHHREIQWSQRFFSVIALVGTLVFVIRHFDKLLTIPFFHWLLLLSFPLAAVFYYGIKDRFNLRNIGFLKPFVIAWVWAGTVTFFPLIASKTEHNLSYTLELINYTLLFKNFLFMSVLCILFDIKDYQSDANKELKTFVVNFGLHRTISCIVFPLCLLGLGAFLVFGYVNHFYIGKILLNTIPFMLAMIVAYSLYYRKSIFYYLMVIDGLMLVKALCGSAAMLCF